MPATPPQIGNCHLMQLGCRNLEASSPRGKRALPSERVFFCSLPKAYSGGVAAWPSQETKEGELPISKRLSKSRSRILVYGASCLGTNGGLELDGSSCGRGPRESLADGEDVEDSSRRRRIESAVMGSDVPRVTLHNQFHACS